MSYNYAFFFAGLIPQTFLSRDAKNQNAKNDVCQHIYIYICMYNYDWVGRSVGRAHLKLPPVWSSWNRGWTVGLGWERNIMRTV